MAITKFEFWQENYLQGRKLEDIVHKFGRATVGTSYVPVCFGNIYRTPTAANATKLRVKAGNVNDTAAGSGAREVTLLGIKNDGTLATESLATAGASASSPTTNEYMRLFRFYVSASGAYATQSAGSHAAAIVIENAAGTEDWGTIDATEFPRGQSEICAYTIPLGFEGWITSYDLSVDSTKSVDAILFQRRNILDTAAPYSAMRTVESYVGLEGANAFNPDYPIGPFPELTDIGFLAKVTSSTASISASFELILVKSAD